MKHNIGRERKKHSKGYAEKKKKKISESYAKALTFRNAIIKEQRLKGKTHQEIADFLKEKYQYPIDRTTIGDVLRRSTR